MEAGALIIFALLVLFAFLGLGVWATVKVVGAAKRGVDRTITQARRTVEDTTLKAKSFGQVGVRARWRSCGWTCGLRCGPRSRRSTRAYRRTAR